MNLDIRKTIGAFPTKQHAAFLRHKTSVKWIRIVRSLPRSNALHHCLEGVSNEILAEVMIRKVTKITCLQKIK